MIGKGGDDRPVRFGAAPAELAEDGFEARFVLLLEVV